MKLIIALVLALSAGHVAADQLVKGHFKKDGTYVDPYYRSSPNSTKTDNYSNDGNTNPYTGQKGYERNDTFKPRPYNSRKSIYDTDND